MKACQRQEGCHKEDGAEGHFGGVPLYSTQTKGNERSKLLGCFGIALLLERIGDWYL